MSNKRRKSLKMNKNYLRNRVLLKTRKMNKFYTMLNNKDKKKEKSKTMIKLN